MGKLPKDLVVIDITTTNHTAIPHGRFTDYSKYSVIQHRYSGTASHREGASNFLEMLEIKNPPKGRPRYVIYEKSSRECFTTWRTLQYAIDAYDSMFKDPRLETLKKRKGFLRLVPCNKQTPWFYAIGDQWVINDYAFIKKIY
jgi:hypothetical protein